MEIPDLKEYPSRCQPGPIPFLTPMFLKPGFRLRAVGWLGKSHSTSGDVPEDCIDRLVSAYENGYGVSDASRGAHTCEICYPENPRIIDGQAVMIHDEPVVAWKGETRKLYGHGHHVVRLDEVLYFCPALILHYILDHGYRPPDPFLKAVREGEFLKMDELRALCTPAACEFGEEVRNPDGAVSQRIKITASDSDFPPCPHCGKLLHKPLAKQCFQCGAEWE